MNKIQEKISNVFLIFKKILEKFPVTFVSILILTVIYSIAFDNDYIDENVLENITIFFVIFGNSTFLIESIIDSIKDKKCIVFYIISAVVSGMFTYLLNIDGSFLGMENKILIERVQRVITCYLISVFVLSIYYNCKKSKKTFEEYTKSVFVNIFKSTIVYGILAIGIAIISSIFIYLILNGKDYVLVFRVEILLLGAYYIPNIMYSFYNMEEETTKFLKIVIKYVLGSLVITAFAIIYMYIIKIISYRHMPSNQIFRILAALFILGCPIWTMIGSFKEEQLIDEVNRKLPILFVPFIFLQIYSIGVRIFNNGITESRYLCVMLVIFEIIYVILYIKNKEKISNILIVFIILSVISFVVPYINMYKVSTLSQYNILKIYKEKTEYTDKEKEKIRGAYYYLKYSTEGEKYINKLFNKEEEKDIELFKDTKLDTFVDKKEYLSGKANLNSINIQGYKNLYIIESNNYYIDKGLKIDDAFKNVKFKVGDKDVIYIDISSTIKKYIENKDQLEDNFELMNEIYLSDNRKLIISNFYLSYDKNSREISTYSIEGYLLD